MNDGHEPKKVLHIIDSFGTGGAETWLLAATKYLKENPDLGLHFDFLLTGGKKSVYDDEVKENGCSLFYLTYSFREFFNFGREFRKILKTNNYIAIHDHQDFVAGWHFLLAGKWLPKIRISHVHNPFNFVHNYIVGPMRWISYWLGRRLMYQLTEKITGTSNAVMDEYGYEKKPYNLKRIPPTYCGFNVSRFEFHHAEGLTLRNEFGWSETDKVALFLGRIGLTRNDTGRNQKNPEFAFEIASRLVKQNSDWKFLFVGFKGENGESLEAMSIKEGLDDRIKFLGIRKDVGKIMSASNCMIFPSLVEGLGMVAVEAQANGLKTIMSEFVPGEAIVCDELIFIEKLGFGPDLWVKKILEVGRHAEHDRKSFNERVRNSPFSIENSVRHLRTLYYR